jgi:hypothetical protein
MTAVQWFGEQSLNYLNDEQKNNLIEAFKQALEMEKQQMINFANDLLARNNKNYIALPDLAEQYYNETYKTQSL